MKKIIIILIFSLTLIMIGILDARQAHQEIDSKYQVIRLSADELHPSTATIRQGTLLIWSNEAPEEVEIQFTNVDNLATQRIPGAELESTCLVQKGEFDYVVSKGTSKLAGKIIVR